MLKSLVFLAFACAVTSLSGLARAESASVLIRYDLSLAGLPIGSAALNATIQNGTYKVDASTKIGGVAALVSDAKGAASATGRVTKSKLLAAHYSIDSRSGKKHQTVDMGLSGGTVTALTIEPTVEPRPDRVPLTEAHKQGVIDPLSALLVPVPGGGEVVTAEACQRSVPVFDGAQRFTVSFGFSRIEQVETKGGYAGPAVVCSARYTPIAGHREKREQVKFMAQNKDLEVWLAPIQGTRLLAPYRIAVGTQMGRLVIAAAKFIETSNQAEAAPPEQ